MLRPLAGFLLLSALPAHAASVVNGGVLLNQTSADQIATWLGEGDLTLTNVYSGVPTSGWTTGWHAAADNIARTVSVIMSDIGLIGGYNPMSWDGSIGSYRMNPTDAGRTAFIFNLTSGLFQSQRLGGVRGSTRLTTLHRMGRLSAAAMTLRCLDFPPATSIPTATARVRVRAQIIWLA